MGFKVSSFADVLGGILTIALATTILSKGSTAGQLLRAAGDSFSSVLNAAQS